MPAMPELDLVQLILADGLSSRLNKALVYDKQLCPTLTAYQSSRELAINFVIYATARPGVSLAEVGARGHGGNRASGSEWPHAERAQPREGEMGIPVRHRPERIGGFGGKADRLNQYNAFLGNPDRFEADVKRHRNAS